MLELVQSTVRPGIHHCPRYGVRAGAGRLPRPAGLRHRRARSLSRRRPAPETGLGDRPPALGRLRGPGTGRARRHGVHHRRPRSGGRADDAGRSLAAVGGQVHRPARLVRHGQHRHPRRPAHRRHRVRRRSGSSAPLARGDLQLHQGDGPAHPDPSARTAGPHPLDVQRAVASRRPAALPAPSVPRWSTASRPALPGPRR